MREGSLDDIEEEWEFEAPQFCDFAIDQLLDADPNNFSLFGYLDWVVTPQRADNWFQQHHWRHESKEKQQELQAQQPSKIRNVTQPAFVASPILPPKQNSSFLPSQSLTSQTTNTTFSSPKYTAHDNDYSNTPKRRAARVPVPLTAIPASSPQFDITQQKTVSVAQLQQQFEGRRNSLENLLNGFVITKTVIDEDSEPEPNSDLENSSLSEYNDRYQPRNSNDSLSELLDSDEEYAEALPRNAFTSVPSKTIEQPSKIESITAQQKTQKKNKKTVPVDVDDVVNDLLQDLDLHLQVAEGSDSEQDYPSGSLSPQPPKFRGAKKKPTEWNNDSEDSYFVVHNQNKKKEAPTYGKKEPTIKLRKPKGTATALSNISNQSVDSSKPEWKRDFSEIARIYKSATQVPSSINLMSTQNPQISFCPAPQKKKGGKVKKTVAAAKAAKESPPAVPQSSVDVTAIEAEVAKMLAEHNKKFKPKSTYEPRKYGIKEIRMWEAESGKKWLECTAAEREEANEWISMHV